MKCPDCGALHLQRHESECPRAWWIDPMLPKVGGVARAVDERTLQVYFARPLTDGELHQFHQTISRICGP